MAKDSAKSKKKSTTAVIDAPRVDPKTIKALNVQQFFASMFHVALTSTTVTVLCQANAPAIDENGNIVPNVGVAVPVAQINLSPQAAKELSVLLSDMIASYEANYGTIKTDFIQQREDAKKQAH